MAVNAHRVSMISWHGMTWSACRCCLVPWHRAHHSPPPRPILVPDSQAISPLKHPQNKGTGYSATFNWISTISPLLGEWWVTRHKASIQEDNTLMGEQDTLTVHAVCYDMEETQKKCYDRRKHKRRLNLTKGRRTRQEDFQEDIVELRYQT